MGVQREGADVLQHSLSRSSGAYFLYAHSYPALMTLEDTYASEHNYKWRRLAQAASACDVNEK